MAVITKGALTTTLLVSASDSLNIRAANLNCDGVADDVQIQEALDAAAGGIVTLLEGTYNCVANIVVPADTKLEGSGFGTVLNFDDGGAGTVTDAGAITVNGDNVCVMNLKAILAAGCGAVNTRPNVIGASSKTLVWLENLWLIGDTSVADDASDLRQCGIMFITVTSSEVINCRSEDCDRHGIHLNDCEYCIVEGNTAQDNTQWGILLYNASDWNTVNSNTSEGNGHGGINIATSDSNTVIGNICEGNTLHGILVYTAANNTIAGNTCQGNSAHGINVSDTSLNNTVTGNTCQGNTNNGIYVHDSSLNNTITGNTCADNGDHGIYISESNENTVTGNQCDDNGGAGDHGILIYRSSYCVITGNCCHNNFADGINVTGDATTNADYNTVTGNNCQNNGDDGVAIEGAGDANKNIVLSNILLNNAGTNLVDNGLATIIGHNVIV